MQDGTEAKPVVKTSSDYITKDINVFNDTTLKSNTQILQDSIAKENAAKEKEKEKKDAERKKYQSEVSSGKRSFSMTGSTENLDGVPDETAEMAAADKFAEENNKFNQTVQMFIDEAQKKYSNDADGYAKFLNAGIETIKRGASKFTMEESTKAIKAQKDLMDNVIQVSYANYWTGKGRPDLAAMALRAESMVGGKQNPNRAGMDKLINDGAQQIEMPEIPDDENAYLAEVITGMVGDIVSNSIAWASGGSTAVAAASVPSAGQQVAANVSAMMATDVKEHREKVEKIRLLNEELRIKHEGDVIAAMIDFDGKVDASEREYNRMKFQATGMEIANAFKVLGMQARADEFIANMGRFIDGVKNEEEKINKSSKFEKSKFDTEWANRIKMAEIQAANDLMMAREKANEARAKGRYVPYKDILGSMSIMIANGMPTAPRAFESMITWQENIEPTYNNIMNYNAGSSKGNDIYAKINGMPIDAKTKAQMTENILIAQTLGYKLNNVTDATLVDIGSRRITTIPKGKGFEEGGDLIQKYFTPISERELSYHVGTMESMLRNLAASSNAQIINIKNSSSDKSTPANLSSFAETTEK